MAAVFQGERNTDGRVSGLAGVYNNNSNNDKSTASHGVPNYRSSNGQLCTPPDEPMSDFSSLRRTVSPSESDISDMPGPPDLVGGSIGGYATIKAWLEVLDYVGYISFRAFIAEDGSGAKSLFAFFNDSVMRRDVKQALMALIELADMLECEHLAICVDRTAPADDAAPLLKGLQWAGFSLTTLDAWTDGVGVDVTSNRWLFMGMDM